MNGWSQKLAFITLLSFTLFSCKDPNTGASPLAPFNPVLGEQEVEKTEKLNKDFNPDEHDDPGRAYAEYINSYLNAPVCPAEKINTKNFNFEQYQSEGEFNLATGAHKIYASQYQSCEALTVGLGVPQPTTNIQPQALIDSLKANGNYPGAQCVDRSARNIKYQFGGKFRQRNGEIDVFQDGVDCSGFVSSAMAAAGLKWSKDQKRTYEPLGTTQIDGQRNSSCMELPVMNEEHTVKPGDIVNSSNNHVVIIDEVGEDPFGLKKISSKSQCDTLSLQDLDFTLIHSSSTRGQSGIHRLHISRYYNSNSISIGLLRNARSVCRAKFDGMGVRSQRFLAKSGDRGSQYVSILRHKGKNEPGCTMDEPTKVRGEKCVEECFKDTEEESEET